MTIGERIHRARRAAGVSQRALAAAVDVSAMAISKFERELLTPSSSRLMAISKALGVPFEYLLRPEVSTPEVALGLDGSTSARDATRIRFLVDDALERFFTTLSFFPEPPVSSAASDLESASHSDPKVSARRLRFAWGLGP